MPTNLRSLPSAAGAVRSHTMYHWLLGVSVPFWPSCSESTTWLTPGPRYGSDRTRRLMSTLGSGGVFAPLSLFVPSALTSSLTRMPVHGDSVEGATGITA